MVNLRDRRCSSTSAYLLCIFSLLLIFQSCSFFSLYEGEPEPLESRYVFKNSPRFSGSIAFTFSNDIYLSHGSKDGPEKITNTPSIKKGLLALSYDKRKIAYLDKDDIPVIITDQGELIEMASPSGKVKDMGWSPDDKTLYMLVNNALEFHGPPMDIDPLEPHISPVEVHAVSIIRDLTVVYTYSSITDPAKSFTQAYYYNNSKPDSRGGHRNPRRHVRMAQDGKWLITMTMRQPDGRDDWNNFGSKQLNPTSGSPAFILEGSYFSVPMNEDSVVFASGPYGRHAERLDPEFSKFTNIYLGPVSGSPAPSYLTFFEENSDEIYLDWKP